MDQSLPHDIEAEQKVLGAAMRDPEALHTAYEVLGTTEAFYFPGHKIIFDHLLKLSAANTPIDLITLTDGLKRSGELECIGDWPYLASLAQNVATCPFQRIRQFKTE